MPKPLDPEDLERVIDNDGQKETVIDCTGDALVWLTDDMEKVRDFKQGKLITLRKQDFDFSTITTRKSKMDALLIQSRGTKVRVEPIDKSCSDCILKQGPFEHCVVLKGYMDGCCGNCKWYDHRSTCSITKTNMKLRDKVEKRPLKPVQREGKRSTKKPERLGVSEDPEAKEIQMMRKVRGE